MASLLLNILIILRMENLNNRLMLVGFKFLKHAMKAMIIRPMEPFKTAYTALGDKLRQKFYELGF